MITKYERAFNYEKVCSCINKGSHETPELKMLSIEIEDVDRELRWKYEHKKYIERHYGTGRKMQ